MCRRRQVGSYTQRRGLACGVARTGHIYVGCVRVCVRVCLFYCHGMRVLECSHEPTGGGLAASQGHSSCVIDAPTGSRSPNGAAQARACKVQRALGLVQCVLRVAGAGGRREWLARGGGGRGASWRAQP